MAWTSAAPSSSARAPLWTPPALIEARGLGKQYTRGSQRIAALSGVSIQIAPGDFVAVLGPSGCGKSTLANLIGCLDTPSGGSYRLDGEEVGRLDRAAIADVCSRKIGFVQPALSRSLSSVARVVEQPLLYRGVAPEERILSVRGALAEVGLSAHASCAASELSGEQQVLLSIAAALANGPSLVLADEPTLGLGTQQSAAILALFQSLNARGRTVVIATRSLGVAQSARRIVRLSAGRVESDERIARN